MEVMSNMEMERVRTSATSARLFDTVCLAQSPLHLPTVYSNVSLG